MPVFFVAILNFCAKLVFVNKSNLNEYLKYIENFDEDFSASDYLPSEITEKDKNFKTKYFDFYDDIKSHTNPKQDW